MPRDWSAQPTLLSDVIFVRADFSERLVRTARAVGVNRRDVHQKFHGDGEHGENHAADDESDGRAGSAGVRFLDSSVASVGGSVSGYSSGVEADAHRFEHARVALRIRRMAGEFFQEHPRQKSAHEREAAELQRDPFERIAAGMHAREKC